MDATCAPVNIYYPQNISLLNEARENWRSWYPHIRSEVWQTGVNIKTDKKQEYQNNSDRIEAERIFSLSKRCYGMDCIVLKLMLQTFINSSAPFTASPAKVTKPVYFR